MRAYIYLMRHRTLPDLIKIGVFEIGADRPARPDIPTDFHPFAYAEVRHGQTALNWLRRRFSKEIEDDSQNIFNLQPSAAVYALGLLGEVVEREEHDVAPGEALKRKLKAIIRCTKLGAVLNAGQRQPSTAVIGNRVRNLIAEVRRSITDQRPALLFLAAGTLWLGLTISRIAIASASSAAATKAGLAGTVAAKTAAVMVLPLILGSILFIREIPTPIKAFLFGLFAVREMMFAAQHVSTPTTVAVGSMGLIVTGLHLVLSLAIVSLMAFGVKSWRQDAITKIKK